MVLIACAQIAIQMHALKMLSSCTPPTSVRIMSGAVGVAEVSVIDFELALRTQRSRTMFVENYC